MKTASERAKDICKLLKKNKIEVVYNDALKSGGRSLKIYSRRDLAKARIAKVKKLLMKEKNVTVLNWDSWYRGWIIRIHVK
jgi:hypothetical protein